MRVAAISYLNAEPLVRGLPWAVERLLPAAMTAENLRGCDLVLAPVTLNFAGPEWELLRDAPAIGCCGAVGSVRLEFAPGYDVASATRFAFSPESQTSNQLLQVLLAFHWERPRETVCFQSTIQEVNYINHLQSGVRPHAWVVIGDRALTAKASPRAIDLGGVWYAWTGLPFVFAGWMRRTGVTVDTRVLCAARDRNLATLTDWLPDTSHLHHFTRQLVYEFGPAQHQGLARFREYVVVLGISEGIDRQQAFNP